MRVVLPGCSVTAIRKRFPYYAGLEISHPHIIVKDQHLIINNKVNFCVCKYNNYFDTNFSSYGQ